MTNIVYHRILCKVNQTLGIAKRCKAPYDLPIQNINDLSKNLLFLNIKNLIVKFDISKIEKLIYPIITETKTGEFHVIYGTNGPSLFLYCPYRKKEFIISKKKVKDTYKGHYILMEKIPTDYNYNIIKPLFRIEVAFYFLLALVVIFHILVSDGVSTALVVMNIFGLLLSFLIVNMEYNSSDDNFHFLCSDKINCSIPKFRNFSLTLPAMGFFSLNLIFLTWQILFEFPSFLVLFLLGFIGLVVGIFSIIYQKFYIRKICNICLTISILLLFQFFIIYLFGARYIPFYKLPDLFFTLSNVCLVFVVLVYYKSYLETDLKLRLTNYKTTYIWTDRSIIEKLMEPNDKVCIEALSLPSLGSKSANRNILLVIDVECKYCLEAYWHLGNLVLLNPDFILQIVIDMKNSGYDNQMFDNFSIACRDNKFLESFRILQTWKKKRIISKYSSDKIGDYSRTSNSLFFEKNKIYSYPHVLVENRELPKFIKFEHFKVAFAY